MNKQTLFSKLKRDGYLKTPNIIQAFERVDRKNFVRETEKEFVYANSALPIGYEQTISQPLVVAFMLELLEPKKGEKILDVGCGSGWQAALLAEIVGTKGRVIAIERIPELAEMAKKNISKYKRLTKRIEIIEGDGSQGFETEAPFDKIIAAASAERIPEAWKAQIKNGGFIVAPIRESIVRLRKTDEKTFEKREFHGFRFVPLVSGLSTGGKN
ncbi:MAG: protein-L-isoaspartate(D-aspartate) O-methyltransferase [Nanoarchaeota archaeon]|nr:protein-L-isoaspartate(D-aspartate) O-methyltransferase [Nanoarchaeota archaeon]